MLMGGGACGAKLPKLLPLLFELSIPAGNAGGGRALGLRILESGTLPAPSCGESAGLVWESSVVKLLGVSCMAPRVGVGGKALYPTRCACCVLFDWESLLLMFCQDCLH